MVALSGFNESAYVIRFKDPATFFKLVIEEEVPSKEEILKFQNPTDFENLAAVKNAKEKFRNFVLVRPYAALAMLSISSRYLPEVATIAKKAVEHFKLAHGADPDFDHGQHDDSITCLMRFSWCAHHYKIDAPVFSANSNQILESWKSKLHNDFIDAPQIIPV